MGCGNSKSIDISEKQPNNVVNNDVPNNNIQNNNMQTHVQSTHIQSNIQANQNVIQNHSSQHQTYTTVTYQQNPNVELEKERQKMLQNYQQNSTIDNE